MLQGVRKELGEDDLKVQTPSYMVNKYERYKVQHDDYSSRCCMVYLKVVIRVDHKKKLFLITRGDYFYFLLYLYK